MVRTYGSLGTRGEAAPPTFLQRLALMAAQPRESGGGMRGPSSLLDYIGNRGARERYARSMLDEQLRGAITGRESTKKGTKIAQKELGLKGREMGLKERSLEEEIRADLARESMGREGMDFEKQKFGYQKEKGSAEMDLARRGLEEQIRASLAGEGLRGREIDKPDADASVKLLSIVYDKTLPMEMRQAAWSAYQRVAGTGAGAGGAGGAGGEAQGPQPAYQPMDQIVGVLRENASEIAKLLSEDKSGEQFRRWSEATFPSVDPKQILLAFKRVLNEDLMNVGREGGYQFPINDFRAAYADARYPRPGMFAAGGAHGRRGEWLATKLEPTLLEEITRHLQLGGR